MNRESFVWDFFTALVVVSGLGLACFIEGCNPVKSAAEADYEAEQLACIDKAANRNEAETCRNAIKARWAADSAPDVAITETIADAGGQ